MRIEEIYFSDDSILGEVRIRCSSGFNLIIGQNGSGKTRLLHVLSQTVKRWLQGKRLPLLPRSAGVGASVEVLGLAPDQSQFHAREHIGLGNRSRSLSDIVYRGGIDRRAQALLAAAAHGDVLRLPLLAHAGSKCRFGDQREYYARDSKLAGWQDSMNMAVEPDSQDWYLKPVGVCHRGEAIMDAVRPALRTGIPGLTNIRWDSEGVKVVIHGTEKALNRLPTSYRAMIGLVGELAWRAGILSGNLEGNASTYIEGVVLIEEIERHLDLHWQRHVVDDLRKAFPRIQFIATTHSPFVVQSMHSDEVINLGGCATMDYDRKSIEDIVEVAMGVHLPQRSERWQRMYHAAAEFFQKLDGLPHDDAKRKEALSRLDELSAPFSDDPAFTAFLARKRARATT